jgi:hypothetical protein
MKILSFDASLAEPIRSRQYAVKLASSIALAEGKGEAHAFVLYFEPGGAFGPHEAGWGSNLARFHLGESVSRADEELAEQIENATAPFWAHVRGAIAERLAERSVGG